MPISTQTDTELFLALRSGNREALGTLYDRYGVLVYRLALKILGNKHDAEDLSQDIFINLSRTTAYDPTRGSMQAFLMVMTRSRAIDRIRKLRSQSSSLQKWQQAIAHIVPDHPMEKVSKHEISDQVRAALQNLPERHRQVLEMAYYEGRSQSEIAQDLGIPLGTIKSWARQGLISLRKVLKEKP
ncbi:RNA polymerase sigma factor, sigma-70 family [Synechococcus sp. PCC 7502]|uniref:sigma-70 family RNA polymerase sigma factor n=1 Tax=Synechococcus sp. PCC 7502 TaxID=1173263 RepID=UPI00029F8419|nr:sigma-70 family RNA polymerase sigma factor [Synechococcus sp. PCC 7502]AFY72552.1 RNA polymerase sigma factor, sigma-70 family [Synechococcus sp. PCC 7502]